MPISFLDKLKPRRIERREDPRFPWLRRLEDVPPISPVSGKVTAPFTPEFGRRADESLLAIRAKRRFHELHSEKGMSLEEFEGLTDIEKEGLWKPGEYVETVRIKGERRAKVSGKPTGVYKELEEELIATVNLPLFNVGGVNITAPDITALGLLAFGGVLIAQSAWQKFLELSLRRNLNSWAKSAGRGDITKVEVEAFVNWGMRHLKPSYLTREAIRTLFKPTKAGHIPPATAKRGYERAEQATSELVKKYMPEFTRTRTEMTIADIRAGKFAERPIPSVAAVQAGRAELAKEPAKPVTPEVTRGIVKIPETQKLINKAFAKDIETKDAQYLQDLLRDLRDLESRALKEGVDTTGKSFMWQGYTIKNLSDAIDKVATIREAVTPTTPVTPEVTAPKTFDVTVRQEIIVGGRVKPESVNRVFSVQARTEKQAIKAIKAAGYKGEIVKVEVKTPVAIPKAEPGMPEAGLQPSMIEEIPAKEVRPVGKGRIVQASLDDLQKLLAVKGKLPTGMGTKEEVRLEIARRGAEQLIKEYPESLEVSISEAQTELSNRALPYHGGARHNLFPEYDTKQLDEYLKVLEGARVTAPPTVAPEVAVTPPEAVKAEVTLKPSPITKNIYDINFQNEQVGRLELLIPTLRPETVIVKTLAVEKRGVLNKQFLRGVLNLIEEKARANNRRFIEIEVRPNERAMYRTVGFQAYPKGSGVLRKSVTQAPVTPPEAVAEGPPPAVPPIPPETGIIAELPSVEPSGKISFANLQDAQTVIDYSTKPDVSRWIANLPGIRQIMSHTNPSAIANTPGERAITVRNVLRVEGEQKAQGVISYLNELGSQEKVFGKLDDNGLLASGKLKGLAVNDIRTYPKRYANRLAPEQQAWITRAHEIEVAKLKFMRDNGIEIKELTFEEGGEYAGRRVFALMSSDGELLDTAYIGAGPTRVGKKAAFEKRRWFDTAKEATDEGYKYLPDDEALSLNVRAAYNRVADKQMSEWLLTQVPWRTTGAPEELILAAESAKMRLNRSLQLSAAINRAVRGERVPDATLNSIARVYPEEALELKLAIPEIQAGRPTAVTIKALTKKAKALIKSDRADWNAAVNARARAREKALAPGFGEAIIMHPAFSGKIFTGPEAKELADTMRKALDPGMSRALASMNKVNALVRYFLLAGDFSPLGIQLIFLAGQNPKIYGGAAASIPRLLLDTKFQAKFLSEHKAVIDRHPGLLLSTAGTEFTEAMAKGGMLSTKINILPRQESFLKNLGLLPPRVIGKAGAMVLSPFQRVFEGTLDYAGIKMAEALEHLAKTPAEMAEVDQFINEFRGLTSSAKLGVSPNWRASETATLLAPRYNRAIAALLADAVKGATTFGQSGIRNRLAIEGLTKGIAAISAMAVAVSLALNEDWEDIAEHFDPNSPRFFTWNIAGTNIGPGTKVRSVVKLVAQSMDNAEALFQNGMRNPALRFIRGNLAPVLGSVVDLLTGKNFIGDPVRSDVVAFTKEMIAGNFLPIWVENVVYEGGTLSQKLLRGAGEFFGGRAYPETESDQVNRLRERYAAKEYGKKYEDLNNVERDALREKYNDLAKIEEEAKIYWAERGNKIERFYFNERQRITDERNAGLEKAAQAYLDGDISKYDYDKERGRIRPYYSGGWEVLWSVKESLDEYSVKQMEKWLDENMKPEDKALGEYQEYRGEMIEGADLPLDWDVIERELESYLTKYSLVIQDYIRANMNRWINKLPPAAKQVEQERAQGIEDETWWDNYRQVGTKPYAPAYTPKSFEEPEYRKRKRTLEEATSEFLGGGQPSKPAWEKSRRSLEEATSAFLGR